MSFFSNIFKPTEKEFPFFAIALLCIGGEDLLRYLLHNSSYFVDSFLNFSLTVLFAYFLTCLVYFIGKYLKILFYAILFFLVGVDIFLGMNFSTEISPQIFLLIAETNAQESKEFLNEYVFNPSILLMFRSIFLYTLLALILEYIWDRKNKLRLSEAFLNFLRSACGVILFWVLVIGLFSCGRFCVLFHINSTDKLGAWYNQKGYLPHNKASKLIYSTYAIQLAGNEVGVAIKNTLESDAAESRTEVNDSLNIVVVIGESYIKSHCQLYGYPLPTTPFLSEERYKGNLFVFNDVISPFNGTSASMKNLLSCNSLSENEAWYTKPIFPAIFKKSGYEVTFWDNQKGDDTPAVVSMSLASFMYNKEICKVSYDRTNDWTEKYDGAFVDSTSEYGLTSKRNLIIYHLMGQHVDAKERYPSNSGWDYFTADSIQRTESYLSATKKQEIAEYDNATRYNDYVLQKIIQRYRNQNTVLVYFSDHGEEIYDYRDHKGRDLSDATISYNYLKYQHEIPFMIWCSDKFKESYPQVIGGIKNSLSKPFMTDNLPHLLFHLAQIKTDYYKESKDLLSSSYNCGERMVHDKDYDQLRGN